MTTWWEWRQQQAELIPLDYDRMREMVAEAREQQERFAALFRPPMTPDRKAAPDNAEEAS